MSKAVSGPRRGAPAAQELPGGAASTTTGAAIRTLGTPDFPAAFARMAANDFLADQVVAFRASGDAGGALPGTVLPNAPAVFIAPGNGGRTQGHLQQALPPGGFALLVLSEMLGPEWLERLLAALGGLPLKSVVIGSERALASAAGRLVLDEDGALAGRFAARDFPLYLVRPDEHVAARLQAGSDAAAVAATLDVALGRRAAGAAQPPPQAADARIGALGREGLERVFEAVSRGVDAAGEPDDRRFLARLALLLAEAVGDPVRVLALVATASEEQASGVAWQAAVTLPRSGQKSGGTP
jgi:3-(3-hydroxy-phenyl)propionate hydroxylase